MENEGGLDRSIDDSVVVCTEPTLTQQQFAGECDINTIVKRATQGQEVTHVNTAVGQYGDFSNVPDYREAFEVVKRAEGLFMALPWQAREKFGNDPQRMVMFLQDPKNHDEAISLGLVKKPEVDEQLDTLRSIDASLKASSGSSAVEPKAKTK